MKTKWMMIAGLIALCGMAQAEVFYSGAISGATSFADNSSNVFAAIIFDITSTNYGIAAYDLANHYTYFQPTVGGHEVEFRIGDLSTFGGVVTTGETNYMGSLLAADAVIGPNSAFTGWAFIKGYGVPEDGAPWNPQWWDESGVDVRGYAGLILQFPAEDYATHYGWVDISYSSSTAQWSVNGWAYETQADTAIGAGDVESIPEPATALLLAIGGGLVWLARLKQRF